MAELSHFWIPDFGFRVYIPFIRMNSKRLALLFGLVFSLAGPTAGYGYHGYAYYGGHGCGGWSFVPGLALGLGFGTLWSSYACRDYPSYSYSYYYPSPSYVYSQPSTTPPSTTAPGSSAQVEASQPAQSPEPQPWVPSTPGAGSWVPDPQPYSYSPTQNTPPKPANSRVPSQATAITTSAGGVPVFSNTKPPAP